MYGACQCILLCGITGMLPYFFYKLERDKFIRFKTHNDQYKQLSSNVCSNSIYCLIYFENICQFLSNCEYRPLAALIYLDYLCKNNRFNVIVGCNLLYDYYTCFRQNTMMTFSKGIIRIILIGLKKLSYLASIMYMHLHKYLFNFKHTYYLYIKYRPHYNVYVYTCHNSKWIYQMQHRNYVWHPEGITMRYDLCTCIDTYLNVQGRSQDLGGGKNFFSDLEICMLQSDMPPPPTRKFFFKWCVLVCIFIRFSL